MTSLEKIFKKCEEYNIFPNLDETFCYTPKRIMKYSSKYIGSIYSKTDINEIAECISEEGSCMLSYVIESKENKEVKITNIFISLLIEYGFDPYVNDVDVNDVNINIIITDRDILNEEDEENDSDYDYEEEDDEENDEDEEENVGNDEEENDEEEKENGNDNIVNDVVGNYVVGNDNIVNDVVGNDVVGNDVVGNDVEENDGVGNDDVVDDTVENDVVGNDDVVDDTVENDVVENDDVVDDTVENDVVDDVVVEDTFEKLKYVSTLTKVQLLNLLLDNKIYEYKTKNIRKLNKTDLQDCAREFIKKINL